MDICKFPSSPTRINPVIILSGMGCGVSSPWHNIATKKRSVKYYTFLFNPLVIHEISCQDISEGIKGGSIYGSQP